MFPWNLFPFSKDSTDSLQKMRPDEVENFIQGILGKMMPANIGGTLNPQDLMNNFRTTASVNPQTANSLHSTTFETHDEVFIRIPVKNEDSLKQLRIYHTSNQLIVEHIPNLEDKHTITLPAIVKKKGATAKCQDGILEIKIPKNIDLQYSEVDLHDYS